MQALDRSISGGSSYLILTEAPGYLPANPSPLNLFQAKAGNLTLPARWDAAGQADRGGLKMPDGSWNHENQTGEKR